MEKLLNILHYSFYVIYVKLDFLFKKITRVDRIFEIPFLKRRYKKLNQDPLKVINELETNKHFGFSIINSGGLLIGSIGIIIFSVILILKGIFEINLPERDGLILIQLIPSYLICYCFVFRKDKYLTYFDEFEKWPKLKKRKIVLISAGFVVGVSVFFFWSLLHS